MRESNEIGNTFCEVYTFLYVYGYPRLTGMNKKTTFKIFLFCALCMDYHLYYVSDPETFYAKEPSKKIPAERLYDMVMPPKLLYAVPNVQTK